MASSLTVAMAVVLLGSTGPVYAAGPGLHAAQSMQDLQSAHIAANVPVGEDFNLFLVRDLTAYFESHGAPDPTITYELLRDGPTQSGVAYPKYYVWVIAVGSDGSVTEGAVRLAAMERTRFEVTDFVSRESIIADADSLDMVVPAALRDATVQRATRP